MGSNNEKTGGQKSHDTLPLKEIFEPCYQKTLPGPHMNSEKTLS